MVSLEDNIFRFCFVSFFLCFPDVKFSKCHRNFAICEGKLFLSHIVPQYLLIINILPVLFPSFWMHLFPSKNSSTMMFQENLSALLWALFMLYHSVLITRCCFRPSSVKDVIICSVLYTVNTSIKGKGILTEIKGKSTCYSLWDILGAAIISFDLSIVY